MKKVIAILAVTMLMVAAAGSAMADTLNPYLIRPVEIGSTYPGENSLQTELDSIFTAPVNAATDQLNVGMFQIANPGSNLIAPQFKFEWTANASSQTIGIFGWDGTNPVAAQIFSGTQTKGDYATVAWTTLNSGLITSFDMDVTDPSNPIVNSVTYTPFSNINRDFFGFYFQVGTTKYYSVDSLNADGEARVLGYMPDLSGAAFSYEDGSDWDYQDAGFFVESIKPVPEPLTILLLGLGLIGLAGLRRK